MNLILKELEKSSKYNDFIKNLENKKSPIAISGLTGVAEASIIAKCLEQTKRPIFIITYNEIQAQALVNDLKFFTEDVAYLPKKEIITYDYVAESKNLPYERIEILNKIYKKQKLIIVTSVETIKQKIISKDTLYKNVLKFKVGDRCDLEVLKQKLVDLGYQRFDLIDGRGEFSVRGGIIDISTTESIGIRIELWGDEIDSIRHFNIISQRSIDNIEKIEIFPAHEYILETSIEKVAKNISNNVYPENISEKVESDLEKIRNVEYISKIDRYFNSFYGKQETVLEYIDDKYLVFVDEFNKVIQRSENIEQDNENTIKALMEKGRIIPDSLKNYVATENLESNIEKYQTIYLDKLDDRIKNGIERYDFKYKELNYFKSGIDLFINDINNFKKQEKKVYIVVDTKEKANKMEKLLAEYDILSIYYEKLNKTIINQDANTVIITLGKISKGFYSIDLNQVVMIASDLVDGTRTIKKRKSETFKQGEKVVFADLKVGDYVVHRRYGIGIYIGVNTITADGTTRDYLKLKYSGDDILYIPTNSLDEIRKYVGGEELNLKLNKLGSKDWEKTTNKVRNNLRAVAKELIELYARREKSKGYAFSKDTEWQKQFEEAFPYVETDDQLRCIDEVKKDMENEKPMDRLLCGDVGYGKTEVAIRAAFKAVMDHKQVAYLAPTTVLAKQQYETFKERMKDFPIRVDVLNRFRTTKDKNRIIKKMKLGEIDILIGTHRLLGKDVEFNDLGLLIIDEEQRFGVKAKEKIKQYKTNVDVLTMTATPIPRTLHMSIVGVRDMSVIYEPPQNRKPVQTYVLEYDAEVIKEAITKELERNGQVFYLFNNVGEIALKADKISRLVPEAKVGFAHGRMTGEEIEDIMEEFVEGKINVLVCTTILESGIDIPNANTIIMENADRVGLAQLYQLRGRVGRSDRQGYAYITYRKDKMLSEVADKRLKAIKEFTEFGSGFKIAMRDLEIRGAGSLIGEIQHGHLEEVGYDTYCRILDEVLKEEQGIKVEEDIGCQIDLNVTSYIPDSFISDQNQKIEIYQDIALCKNEEDIRNVIDEIIDRFGNMPNEIENLLEISRIKQLAKEKYLTKIQSRGNSVVFTYDTNKFDNNSLSDIIKKYGNRIKFSAGIKPMITLKIEKQGEKGLLQEVKEFLK
jgi:transcription-repair coupling factor (superfamily II helicase)